VQRIWSNQAAINGDEPCVPAGTGEVYFNAAPEMNDTVTTFAGAVHGIQLAVGASKTVPIDLFSDGPTAGPISVQAVERATLVGGTPSLTFSFNRTSGVNGDKLMLTVTQGPTNRTIHTFFVISKVGTATHLWVGIVGQM
jgi:hypothetical protein